MDYYKLQNGSDIRGVALPGIEGQDVNLTEDACRNIGRGFALWLKDRLKKDRVTVAIGRDSRLSGPDMLRWASEAMASAGADVTDTGLSSTPAMFMATVTGDAPFDGAVMVTASHLPFNRNGYKFFTAEGGLEKEDIHAILALASTETEETPGGSASPIRSLHFMKTYAGILREKIRQGTGEEQPLKGLKIIVDAGNGAGGFFAGDVLSPLGADVTGSQFLDPDGSFPNHIPNPEDKKAMASITDAVLANHADLGIIFDTDVDRAGAVLPDGSELNRNGLIAMMASILLHDHPGTTIVTDSVTSTGLARFIAEKGGVHHRFKRGYRNVINEAIRLNRAGTDAQLAMETSGHGALKENYFLDDGAYLMVKLLIELANLRKEGKDLQDLVDGLEEPKEASEFRFTIDAPDFRAYGQQVLDALAAYAATQPQWTVEPVNYEGVRVNSGDGWFLLRLSLHDPVLPLNIEGDSEGAVRRIVGELAPFLGRFEQLSCPEFCAGA